MNHYNHTQSMEDEMRFMLDFINSVSAFGTDPLLADILTEDNSMQVAYLKDCIAYLADVDFALPDDEYFDEIVKHLGEADDWSVDYIRGLTLGILMGIDTDSKNPMGFKHEMALLYRFLTAILIEKRFG